MIELPEHIQIEEVPIEKRYRSVTAGLIRRIKILYDAIYKKFGKEGLDLIREVGDEYGREIAERARKKVKAGDLESVALYVIRIFNTLRGNGEVVEFSDKRVVIRVRECPYPWETPEMCEAHTRMEKTLVETLGKNLRYRIDKSIPKGDSYCDHVIEIIDPNQQ
ncbi:MAG: L-2-amino-thiazoline-4-carboxylic acid hydrolase [Candidatus Aminicenantes bacterium]|nr:L-2-amino-thiazoline-4-carboxylic acid hydrolase [Candidatus Aminicenantes bacterium]